MFWVFDEEHCYSTVFYLGNLRYNSGVEYNPESRMSDI